MKRILILTVLLILVAGMFAQEQTLFDNDEAVLGGFIGPELRYTTIDGQNAVLVGGRAALTLNKTFAIGGSGFGVVNQVDARADAPDGLPYVGLGYGGLDIEGIVWTDKVVHFTIGTMIGAGAVVFNEGWDDDHDEYYYDRNTEADGIWVFEPRAYCEVNLLKFMRLNVGGGYRIVSDVDADAYENEDFSGPFFGLFLKFGGNFKDIHNIYGNKSKN